MENSEAVAMALNCPIVVQSLATAPCVRHSLSSTSFPVISRPWRRHPVPVSSSSDPNDVDAEMEARLAAIQRKVGSGSGRKADARKGGRLSTDSDSVSSRSEAKSSSLPLTSIRDVTSAGLAVSLGFNAYTERLNGKFATVGLAAILLVELASGGSLMAYHDGATLGVQFYFVLCCAAIFVKLEKEKGGIWPN